MTLQKANTLWRAYNTDGVPSTLAKKPEKAKIREWGTYVEHLLGSPEFYGAVGDDVADDTDAFDDMIDAGVTLIKGTPGAVYRYTGQWVLPDNLHFDGQGATFKPIMSLSDYALKKPAPTRNSWVITVASFPSAETFTVVGTPPTVGKEVFITFGTVSGINFRRVIAVAGQDVTLDAPLADNGSGTCTMYECNFYGDLTLENLTFDLSGISGLSAISVIYPDGYEHATFRNLKFINSPFVVATASTGSALTPQHCKKVLVEDCDFIDYKSGSDAVVVTWADSAQIVNNNLDGDTFAFTASLCRYFEITGNLVRGRLLATNDSNSSTRGLKCLNCDGGIISGNGVENFSSGVKIESSRNAICTFNDIKYCEYGIQRSEASGNALHSHDIIAHNIISRCTVAGIACLNTGAAVIDVTDNLIRYCPGDGIIYQGVSGNVTGNKIFEWDTAAAGTEYAIKIESASFTGIFDHNWASNTTVSALCYSINASATTCKVGDSNYSNVTTPFAAKPPLAHVVDVISGSGAPTGVSAPKGTLYVNITATTTTTRLYINTDGGTTWTNFTTAA